MSTANLVTLAILFFLTSIVGVVTGSNSLITVPVMFQFGIDAKVAVATNMFGLTFMAVGGTIPFFRQGTIHVRRLSPFILVTILGSAIGAALVGLITNEALKVLVLVGMIAIVIFTIVRPQKKTVSEVSHRDNLPPVQETPVSLTALVLTFILAIYGGLYSGGYVTVLTVTLIAFAGMTFAESIAATKLINVFSSGIATLVFMWQGLVDYSLGIILAVAMFLGAFVGAHYAIRLDEVWLRRIFLVTVFLLAAKTLFDFL